MTKATVRTLGELAEGLRAVVTFTVTPSQMQQFAELSGDRNPLHTDEAFARSRGFDGVVVYGGLTVAMVSQLIGMHLPGQNSVWVSIALDFHKPLYVGQPAEAEGVITAVSEATGMVGLKLTVRALGKTLAKGAAEVIVAR